MADPRALQSLEIMTGLTVLRLSNGTSNIRAGWEDSFFPRWDLYTKCAVRSVVICEMLQIAIHLVAPYSIYYSTVHEMLHLMIVGYLTQDQ